MTDFSIHQFDANTFVVADAAQGREICVCSNYDEQEDAMLRAKNIAWLLNTFGWLLNLHQFLGLTGKRK
jgi:hypothetical protein